MEGRREGEKVIGYILEEKGTPRPSLLKRYNQYVIMLRSWPWNCLLLAGPEFFLFYQATDAICFKLVDFIPI